MINISKKTLQDLEFESVIMQVASHNVTSLGKTAILETIPFSKKADVVEALQLTNEFVASFENENRIPNHGFDAITKELKLIKIENNYLEIDGFRKIVSICITTNVLLKFFKKFHEYYPLLNGHSSQIETNTSISESINSVIDKYGEIIEINPKIISDAIIRLIPGVLGNETSALTDSFQDGLLAPPIYTKPREYKGWKVPELLFGGNFPKIEKWREEQAIERTKNRRPDLLED